MTFFWGIWNKIQIQFSSNLYAALFANNKIRFYVNLQKGPKSKSNCEEQTHHYLLKVCHQPKFSNVLKLFFPPSLHVTIMSNKCKVSLSNLSVFVVKKKRLYGSELKELKAGESLWFALKLFSCKTRSLSDVWCSFIQLLHFKHFDLYIL